MKKFHSAHLFWIGDSQVSVDVLHEHIQERLGENYEIGDAGIVLNEMIAEGRLDINAVNIIRKI